MSLLVYTPKITPRFRYVFRQLFVRILDVPLTFTSRLDEFVAFSGPKFSYSQDQLGREFHVYATPLLWEQGIQDRPLELSSWKGLPVIFSHDRPSRIPFDLFAASFYCLSRYEEHVPHLQDTNGRYKKEQSWVVAEGHLQKPLVDLWALAFWEALQEEFPDLSVSKDGSKASKLPLIEVVHPLKYRFKPTFTKIIQCLHSLWVLHIWDVIEQLLVELRLVKDPYDTYETLNQQIGDSAVKPQFFFSFAQKAWDGLAVNIHNTKFQSLVKSISDDFNTSLLVSSHAQQRQKDLTEEIKNIEKLIHRPIHTTRFNKGLRQLAVTYPQLLQQEVIKDFSMGYESEIGYRASTAVPFFFYDLQNEYQTPLLLYPVLTTEAALRKLTSTQAFETLNRLYVALPTPTAVQCVVFTNAIWQDENVNASWKKEFFQYLEVDA